ncbi:hypothetical protein [Burkholderia pyrrocinia]
MNRVSQVETRRATRQPNVLVSMTAVAVAILAIVGVVVAASALQLVNYDLGYYALRVTLALASATIAAFLPGALRINLPGGIRGGGALGVFALVFVLAPHSVLPAAQSGSVILKNGFQSTSESGYVFGDEQVVDWYANKADLLVATPPGESQAQFFVQHDMPPYTNSAADERAYGGIRPIASTTLKQVKKCPTDGYQHAYQPAVLGQTYCLRTRDGRHYVALRVNGVSRDRVDLEYVYQPNGSPEF